MDANFFMISRAEPDTDRDDLRVLDSLDVSAQSLLKQGKVEKALDYMQMAARFRRRIYGDRSKDTIDYCRNMMKTVLQATAQRLDSRNAASAIPLLEGVQQAVSGIPVDLLASETCGLHNSLALSYRRQGDVRTAKHHISKALQIAETFDGAQMDRAAAHLNMCVLQSTLGQHKEALGSGLKAVQYAQEDLVDVSLDDKANRGERVSVLAVSYHNVGVEQEHLKRRKEAVEWYSRAVKLLENHGRNESLLAQVQRSLQAASQGSTDRDRAQENLLPKRKSEKEPHSTPHLMPSLKVRLPGKSAPRPGSSKGRHSQYSQRADSLANMRQSEMSSRELRDETPPSVYQQFAMANSLGAPFAIPPSVSLHDLSETQQDIKDLEAMGLLEYSREGGSPLPSARVSVQVRGRKRGFVRNQSARNAKGSSPSLEAGLGSWDEVTDHMTSPINPKGATQRNKSPASPSPSEGELLVQTETKPRKLPFILQTTIAPKETKSSVAVIPAKQPVLRENVPLFNASSEALSVAATKIQARFRAHMAAKQANFRKIANKRQLEIHRIGRKLRNGAFALITVRRESTGILIQAEVNGTTLELRLAANTEGTLGEIAQRVEINVQGTLELEHQDTELAKAAVILQALFRGKKAREGLRKAREVRIPPSAPIQPTPHTPALPLSRASNSPKPRDLLSSLISSKVLSFPAAEQTLPSPPDEQESELKLSIPFQVEGRSSEEISSVIENEVIPRLSIENGQMTLNPEVTKEDVGKITIMQSLFRMKREREKFHKKKQEERLHPIAKGTKAVPEGEYLFSIGITLDQSTVEADAYPLTKGLRKPEKLINAAAEVRTRFGWSVLESWDLHEQELLSAVTIEAGKVAWSPLGASPLYQTENDLGTMHMFAVTCIREGADIVIEAKSLEDSHVSQLRQSEAKLKELLQVEKDWTPVYWRELVYRLQLTPSKALILPSAKPASVSLPFIVVSETKAENIIGTELYTRIQAEPITHTEATLALDAAATRIQARIRGVQTRSAVGDLQARARKVTYRAFRLIEGRGYALHVYGSAEHLESQAWDLETRASAPAQVAQTLIATIRPLIPCKEAAGEANSLAGESLSALAADPVFTKSLVLIQKNVRGLLTRRKLADQQAKSSRKLKFSRRKLLGAEEFFVSIYSHSPNKLEIETCKVNKPLQLQYRTQTEFFTQKQLQSMYQRSPTFEMIYEDLNLVEGLVKLQPKKRLKEVPPDRNLLPLASNPLQPGEPRTVLRASKKLDTRMWVITLTVVDFSPEQTEPHPNDMLEFSAFCGGVQTAQKVCASLGRLSEATKQPLEALYPIGILVINRMLNVSEAGELWIDFEAEMPDIDRVITRVQALIRGFLIRHKVKYAKGQCKLIACAVRQLNNAYFTLYAYDDLKGVVLEATKRSPKETYYCILKGEAIEELPENINRKKVIEDFVFPRLQLVADPSSSLLVLRVVGYLDIPNSNLDAYIFKPKNLEKKIDFRAVRRTHTLIKQLIATETAPLSTWQSAQPSPPAQPLSLPLPSKQKGLLSMLTDKTAAPAVLSKQPKKAIFEYAGEEEEEKEPIKQPVYSMLKAFPEGLSPVPPASREPTHGDARKILKGLFAETTPETSQRKSQTLSVSFKRNTGKTELVVRSGLEFLGEFYTASVFDVQTALLVELLQPTTKEELRHETEKPVFTSNEDRDQYCSELLTRIIVTIDSKGGKQIEIAPGSDHGQVLYRRSHYLSDRYAMVTVTEAQSRVLIWAHDPAKSVHLKLVTGVQVASEAEETQKIVLQLVKRLQIETVKGQEQLVLGPA